MTFVRPARALLSVSDKTGLAEFARGLARHGIALISTGGTARALAEAGLAVQEVASLTGQPEILDGRVKTLQPRIHGGILARRDDPAHMATLAAEGIDPIDLVVVNLYPFAAAVAAGADFTTCIETIDIGGPAMVRAAAKNHADVAIVTDPGDYDRIIAGLDAGGIELDLRRELARKAFAHTAAYDTAIAGWLARETGIEHPDTLTLAARLAQPLRYGENPHQRAALYRLDTGRPGVASGRQLQGKALSFNNLQDADAAVEVVAGFERPTAAVIKHTNPCGVASADSVDEAWRLALAADPVSAFGGIVALNRPVDAITANGLASLFLEVVVAPAFETEARAILEKKGDLRVIALDRLPGPEDGMTDVRSVAGGLLVQDRDIVASEPATWTCATRREPSNVERRDLAFAWQVVRHVRSNAIVIAAGETTTGIGCGQTSRVGAVDLAARQTREARHDGPLVLASDAFFPFPDGIERAAEAGVTAIVQPGGSRRDPSVIEAADRHDIAMLLTGYRHFKH